MTKRFDWSGWIKRLSTVLTGLSAGFQAAGLYFIAAPPEWKDAFPAVFGFALLGMGIATNLLIPIATSFRQNGLGATSPEVADGEPREG
jgi:hypothetical protein